MPRCGIDMTPEMIAKACDNASLLGVSNVMFLRWEIESLVFVLFDLFLRTFGCLLE